jgi:hypothetical protein
MNQQSNSQDSTSPQNDIEMQEDQPESGSIDREERMSVRQSSPTNPRVADKPEVNQEEA